MSDFDVVGAELLLAIGIKCDHRDARAVARDFAGFPKSSAAAS
ncbi:hypothetical protein AB5I41_14440 [Sphingomonas sp. MMS24-JH45]